MTSAAWALVFFVACMLCILLCVGLHAKAPRVALLFESIAFGCVWGVVSAAVQLHQ